MSFTRIYVDSNIFIRAFEGASDDPVSQGLLSLFGLSGSRANPAFVTSQMTLAEMLVQPIRDNDLTRQLQYKVLLSASSNWLNVSSVSRSVLVSAAAIRAGQKMKLPDAIHMATAKNVRCSHVLTADADFGGSSFAPTEANISAMQKWLSE